MRGQHREEGGEEDYGVLMAIARLHGGSHDLTLDDD